MKKKELRKLRLAKETLRKLEELEVRNVEGGVEEELDPQGSCMSGCCPTRTGDYGC